MPWSGTLLGNLHESHGTPTVSSEVPSCRGEGVTSHSDCFPSHSLVICSIPRHLLPPITSDVPPQTLHGRNESYGYCSLCVFSRFIMSHSVLFKGKAMGQLFWGHKTNFSECCCPNLEDCNEDSWASAPLPSLRACFSSLTPRSVRPPLPVLQGPLNPH